MKPLRTAKRNMTDFSATPAAAIVVALLAVGCGRTGAGDATPAGELPTAQPAPDADDVESTDIVSALTGDALVAAIPDPPDQMIDFDGPATCHWTVTSGERSFAIHLEYESAQDAFDVLGFCPMNYPADTVQGQGLWPLANPLAVEVAVTTPGGRWRGEDVLAAPHAAISLSAVGEHLATNGWTLSATDATPDLAQGVLTRTMLATSTRGELTVELSEGAGVAVGESACDLSGDPVEATCISRRPGIVARVEVGDVALTRELFWALELAMSH